MTMIPTSPNGSATWRQRDLFLPEQSTPAASSRSIPMTSPDTTSATSSPALRAGPMPSRSPAGPMTAKSGPPAVPVSRFRARDAGLAMPTNDTSGPLFTASSPSAALQRSLESRLVARMDVNGSPEYALTWSTWDMPSGPPICRLRASAPRISGKDFSGWPTPRKSDDQGGPRQYDGKRGATLREAIAGWSTPANRDYCHPNLKTYTERGGGRKGEQLANQVVHFGPALLGSPASTARRGALNPAYSRWLMGYPEEWDVCAPTATRSSRR